MKFELDNREWDSLFIAFEIIAVGVMILSLVKGCNDYWRIDLETKKFERANPPAK